MASEITFTNTIKIENGNFKVPLTGAQNVSITQTNPGGGVPGFLNATVTDAVAFVPADLGFPGGFARVKNADLAAATSYVQVGPKHPTTSTVVPFHRLYAGEEHVFRLDDAAEIWVKASAGTIPLQIEAYNK